MKQRKIKKYYLYTVKLSYDKSLRTIDKKTWFGTNLLDIISVHKLDKRKDMMLLYKELRDKYDGILNKWNDVLKDIIHTSGYDSIIYKNKYENKGSEEDSIIIFDKNNIEIVDIKEVDVKFKNLKGFESFIVKLF